MFLLISALIPISAPILISAPTLISASILISAPILISLKTEVSVCLAAKADGTKLKPFIVFPGAKRKTKLLNEEFKAKCVVASSTNGWMNEELTLYWVRSVLGRFSFTRRMFALDSFKFHVMETVKRELLTSKIDPLIILGGVRNTFKGSLSIAGHRPLYKNSTKIKNTTRYIIHPIEMTLCNWCSLHKRQWKTALKSR